MKQQQAKPSTKQVAPARRQFKAAKSALMTALIDNRDADYSAAVEQWWQSRNVLEAARVIEPAHVLVKRLIAAHARA